MAKKTPPLNNAPAWVIGSFFVAFDGICCSPLVSLFSYIISYFNMLIDFFRQNNRARNLIEKHM